MGTDDLIKLRGKLPNNWSKMISERTGASIPAVYRVMRGDYVNHEIIDAALEIAAEYKQRQETRTKLLKKIIE
jgi:hypothetical protein